MEVPDGKHPYQRISDGFLLRSNLNYVASIKSLEHAIAHINDAETHAFIDEFLFKMVGVLLRQAPPAYENGEKKSIDGSLILMMDVLLLLPRPLLYRNLHVLSALCFDTSSNYYAGIKSPYAQTTPGHMAVRDDLLRKFVSCDGFQLLYDAPQDETTNQSILWMNGSPEVLRWTILALLDSQLDASFKGIFVEKTLSLIMSLTEEQLKKDNVLENLSCTFQSLKELCSDDINMFYKFWMDHTFKLMRSGTLLLKLFSWEQMQELIVEAADTDPHVSSYLVQGASIDFVNGVYDHVRINEKEKTSLVYVKKPTTPDGQELSLFRCKMKNGASWWFLSQADKASPGSDKDIDFYQQQKTKAFEFARNPPHLDWEPSAKTPPGSIAPFLEPRGLLLDDGITEEMTLSKRLVKWSLDRKLIEEVFGSSIHRAVVGNSKNLLDFLAKHNAIVFEDLVLIWNSALACEVDTADEVLTMMVHLAMKLKDGLFGELIDFLVDCFLKEEANTVTTVVQRIALFLEKFAPISSVVRPYYSIAKLLDLFWVVYRSSIFTSLKTADFLLNLLTSCLVNPSSNEYAVKRITDCVQLLPTHNPKDEKLISNSLYVLDFLLSIPSLNSSIDDLETLGIPSELFAEIKRFVESNRSSSGTDWYSTQLKLRLRAVRLYYGISAAIDISREELDTLWNLFKAQPSDLENFFRFLIEGTDKTGHILPMISQIEARVGIFVSFVCSEEVQWGRCGQTAFECFYTFFKDLRFLTTADETLTECGVRTLWSIFKTIPDEECTRQAVLLLLAAYGLVGDDDSTVASVTPRENRLLPIVLGILAENEQALASRGSLNIEESASVIRCVDLLSIAITCNSSASRQLSHAVRNIMGRIQLTVNYRKSLPQYSTMSRSSSYSRGGEGSLIIEVHPMHTFKTLKEKIAEVLKLDDSTKILFRDHDMTDCPDSWPLQRVSRLVDEAVVDCVYIQSPSNSYTATSSPGSARSGDGATIGDVLAAQRVNFQCLLTFCDAMPNSELSRKIWDLIMLIPTQGDCMTEVLDAQDSTGWAKLLTGDAAAVAYNLQIIDSLLQPAPEIDSSMSALVAQQFKETFISNGGFSALLQVLITYAPSTYLPSEAVSRKLAMSVALHTLCLISTDMLIGNSNTSEASSARLSTELNCLSGTLIEKLLEVASAAAAEQDTGVVENALSTINDLVRDPTVASHLIQNAQSKVLIVTVLKSESKKVRSLSAEFAIKVGGRQPLVFSWLLADLSNIDPLLSSETFHALTALLQHFCNDDIDHLDFQSLAQMLSDRILAYPSSPPETRHKIVVDGYLQLLNALVTGRPAFVMRTELGRNFVTRMFDDYLFTMPPEEDKDGIATQAPVCETPDMRRTAFSVMGSFLSDSQGSFEQIISEISKLTESAAPLLKSNWNYSVAHDIKKPDIAFTGLKNQGCTCYLNSCLQQIFMCKPFREAILALPIKETQRTSIFHRGDQALVGLDLQFNVISSTPMRASAATNEIWHNIKVISYDPVKKLHTYRMTAGDSSTQEIEINFHSKNIRMRLAPEEGEEPTSPSLEAAIRVVEQLQRAFCYMSLSKKRFYDPQPLVEACKTLGLHYNVYQQNDAAEFFDTLVDRIEAVAKDDVWSKVFKKFIFGGKMIYEKIPLKCERYYSPAAKSECGHFVGSRTEDLTKVLLPISNHENVHDSLTEAFNVELMDGDNKINCDVCNEKKATNRRTSIGSLPRTMVLHLKRFDLDFQTFEVCKLDNKMEFPLKINMLEFTKEGRDIAAKKAEREESEAGTSTGGKEGIEYEEPVTPEIDPADYEYDLQGVLIHSGVAQGGHYYSFARDPNKPDKWFRMDDDVVEPFNYSRESIAYQCFGGTFQKENGVEENRTANALLLFYSKSKSDEIAEGEVGAAVRAASAGEVGEAGSSVMSTDETAAPAHASKARYITGMEAYAKEVQESNTHHTLMRYMLDADLHAFVRSAIHGLVESKSAVEDTLARLSLSNSAPDDLLLQAIQFGCRFFLSVVLHCRERLEKDWISCLRNAFNVSPHSALWFVQHLTTTAADSDKNSWLSEFVDRCTDGRAKSAFVQLVVAAVSAISPSDLPLIPPDRLDDKGSVHAVLLSFLIALRSRIFDVPKSLSRSPDDLFVLIREIASVPSLRRVLLEMQTISALSYFILHDMKDSPVSPAILALFPEPPMRDSKKKGFDVESSSLSILEAIAAILDVPQLRKVQLLVERHNSWDNDELSPEAREAFSRIFTAYQQNGYMNESDFSKYFSKGYGRDVSPQALRPQFERYSVLAMHGQHVIQLGGFLNFQVDRFTLQGEKALWNDLHAHGFRNDLKNAVEEEGDLSAASSTTETMSGQWAAPQIPESCFQCLSEINLYKDAYSYHRKVVVKGILSKICFNNLELSLKLIRQACEMISTSVNDYYAFNNRYDHWTSLIRAIISNGDAHTAAKVRETMAVPNGYFGMVEKSSSDKNSSFVKIVLEFIKDLLLSPELATHILPLANEHSFSKKVLEHIQITQRKERIQAMLPTVMLVVEGTKQPNIDGEYFWHDQSYELNLRGHFSRADPAQFNRSNVFRHPPIIHQQDSKGKSTWRISEVNIRADSKDDIRSIFYAPDTGDNAVRCTSFPPENGWSPAIADAAKITPPTVTIKSIPQVDPHRTSTNISASYQSSDDDIDADVDVDTSSNVAEGDDDYDLSRDDDFDDMT